MTTPVRILHEEGHDLARALLRADADDRPPQGSAERVLAALGVGTATGLAAGASIGVSSTTPRYLQVLGTKWFWAGGFGVAIAAGGVLATLARSPAPRTEPVVSIPVPSTSATSGVAVDVPAPAVAREPSITAVEADPRAPTSAPTGKVARAPRKVDGAESLSRNAPPDDAEILRAEIASMDDVRAALARGDGARALTLLDDHDRKFPSGHLAPEAFVTRIDALVRTGNLATARALADNYLARHPTSPHAGRIRKLVGASAEQNP